KDFFKISHDRNIERLDSSVFYLNDVTARLNTSLVGHVRNLESVEHRTSSYRTVISDLVEQQTTHENEFDRFKHTITGTVNRIHDHHQQYWDQIERNNNSITRFETWIKSAEEWLQQLDENV
uniref:Uncharacterized protein n=1 Tax=Ciona intestinalis TaxID=7719 RepID=H2XKX1_CIOIN